MIKTTYFKQLDSLRGIAVLLVIAAHYLSQKHFINRHLPNGLIGVTLFFVLSGFLITAVLIKNKAAIESGKVHIWNSIKTFYIRRSLRIFPAYYLLIFIAIIIPSSNFLNEGGWWHVFYLSNFYFYIYNVFIGRFGIFWSLSVEEQFYLFWPTLVFLVPAKYFIRIFLVGIICAIVFRYFITTQSNSLGRFLLPGSLDSFCIGAIVSYSYYFEKNKIALFLEKFKNSIILFSLILFFVIHFVSANYHVAPKVYISLYLFLLSIVLGIWVWVVAHEVKFKPVKFILETRFLLFTGKISYGLYLFQNFIPEKFPVQFPHSFMFISIYIVLIIRLAILYSIASISWFLFEKQILKLKNRFTYF